MSDKQARLLPQSEVLSLLQLLATWCNTTTIVLHGGCVFEFKGAFPSGSIGEGFFNFGDATPGFHGHLNLDHIVQVSFQDRPHRGRNSYAFVFEDAMGELIFKVFLGRNEQGEILPEQLADFESIRERLSVQ